MDSQLAGKVLLSNHIGQKLEVARFLLAIEHLLVWNVLDEGMKTCSSSKFRTKFLSLVSFSTALLSLTLFDPAWPSVSLSLSLSLPSLSLFLSLSLSLSLSLPLSLYIFHFFFFLLLFGPSWPLLCAVGILKVDSCLLNLSYNKQTFLNWTELNWNK